MSHEEFASRYKYLSTKRPKEPIEAIEICREITESYVQLENEIRVGKSQMYATEKGIELAERWKFRIRQQAACVVQRWWRERLRRQKAAVTLQNWWRTVVQTRAVNRVKRWWKRKRSTAQILSKVRQICVSVRIIQRTVRRWLIHTRAARQKRAQISLPSTDSVAQVIADESCDHDVKLQVSPKWGENNNCAKLTQSPNLISLQLSRANFFYSVGVISIRRPPTVL